MRDEIPCDNRGANLGGALPESMKAPHISVIIPSFNAADTIATAIDSFAVQDSPDHELIIVDGGSTDCTVETIQTRASTVSRWISKKDSGIYEAMNRGIELAAGEWIYFLGADDQLASPSVLREFGQKLKRLSKNQLLAYADVEVVSRKGRAIAKVGAPWSDETKHKFRYEMPLCHQGIFHRRTLFEIVGRFDTTFAIAADHELVLRSLSICEPHYLNGPIVARMACTGISGNGKNTMRMLSEIKVSCVRNGVSPNHWRLAIASLRALLRGWAGAIFPKNAASHLLDFGRLLLGRPRYWSLTD
jgi:glycosyltransferase involved in cell wall biosynthesis